MDAMLSTSEVAELTGISLRHVKRLAASNKLPCEKTVNSNNRPKYLFPLSGLAALDPTLPQRYLAQHAQEGTAEGAAEPQNAKRGRGRPRKGGAGKTAASKPLEEYSTEERGEIAFWTQAVQDWRGYRAGYRDKAAADEAWLAQFRLDHPEVHITRKILYARQRAVLEDDLDGLVDGRGKARRGYCKIPAAAWDAFMYYYLDQRQSPIKQCYDQTIYFLEQHCPEALPVPDYTTFYRHVMADVPEPVKVMGREGPKAFYDRCSHYIRREYENMQSNEYWIADTHTFDVVTKGDGGGTHRLYLTAFMDARSGIFVGCHVADTNSSQNVLTALRRGILRYGIPDQIRKIYAIGQALGIVNRGGEDALHDLVYGVTGKSSVKELSYSEACKVIGELEARQGTPPPRPKKTNHRKRKPGGVSEGQERKVWALMYRLAAASPSTVAVGDRLRAAIKKEAGVDAFADDPFAWLDYKSCNKLIEALKGYVKNAERKAGAADG